MSKLTKSQNKLWNKMMLYHKLQGGKPPCCLWCRHTNLHLFLAEGCPEKKELKYYLLFNPGENTTEITLIKQATFKSIPVTICNKFFQTHK